MRQSEIRALQKEKHDAEHSGTALTASAYAPIKPANELHIILLMKEDIRNQAAIIGGRNYAAGFFGKKKTQKADNLRDLFWVECEAFQQGFISFPMLEKLYKKFSQELTKLNEFQYENHED